MTGYTVGAEDLNPSARPRLTPEWWAKPMFYAGPYVQSGVHYGRLEWPSCSHWLIPSTHPPQSCEDDQDAIPKHTTAAPCAKGDDNAP